MENTIEAILASLADVDRSPWGVGVAARHLKDMAHCFSGDGLCPTKIFNLDSADVWAKQLQEAANRLVWADPETRVKSHLEAKTDGSILDFDAVLTSKSIDRDGDVLHPKGLDVDPEMPLLWQHIQLQPIGKLKSLVSQDDDQIVAKFGIADTALGRDAAILTKFGAMRISHGFKPKEFSPRKIEKTADGKEHVRGWDIRKATTFEGSLVSIPANADARVLQTYEKEFDGVCTAYSRQELKSDLAKLWAKGIFDQRPVHAQGASLPQSGQPAGLPHASATIDLDIKVNGQPLRTSGESGGTADGILTGNADSEAAATKQDGMGHDRMTCPKCKTIMKRGGKCKGCGHADDSKSMPKAGDGKSFDSLDTKDLNMAMGSPYMPGSWEWIESRLQKSAKSYLESQSAIGTEDGYVSMVGTFDGFAIVCFRQYGRSYDEKADCFRMSWSMSGGDDDEAKPVWSGPPQAVSIEPQVIEKAMAERSKSADHPQNGVADAGLDELVRHVVAKAVSHEQPEAALDSLADVSAAIAMLKEHQEHMELSRLVGAE